MSAEDPSKDESVQFLYTAMCKYLNFLKFCLTVTVRPNSYPANCQYITLKINRYK